MHGGPVETPKAPRPRWKTISLRGLLWLILILGFWLGWVVNRARRQREAVAALQPFGGFVHHDWEFINGPVSAARASPTADSPRSRG